MKRGEWEKIPGKALSECTLGVIGVGNIGKAVTRRARAFGMHGAVVERAVAGVTHVLHLATCKETPDDVMDVTVKGLFWLLEACRASPTQTTSESRSMPASRRSSSSSGWWTPSG